MIDAILESLSTLIVDNYWLAPLFAIFAGVLVSFTPCSLSSVPLIIGYVGNTKSKDNKNALKLSLIFALGMSLTFTTLGVIATLAGQIFRFTGDWWYIFLSLLLIIMTLEYWNIINLVPNVNLLTKSKRRGFIGAFITGILAGMFSSPCSTPVLIVLLTIVSAQGSLLYGILLLLMYSIGHSFLTIIAGTSVGFANKIKNNKNYNMINNVIKIIFGILVLVLAFYMFYLGI